MLLQFFLLTCILLDVRLTLSFQWRHLTSNGGTCMSECSNEGKSYYWCKQRGYTSYDWDYCSPCEGIDYQFNKCLGPCETKGESYKWCKTDHGWGYCGHVTTVMKTHFTRYGKICITDCEFENWKFHCYDIEGEYQYCSETADATSTGLPCRNDHHCDLHGESYYWCYTDDNNNWEYCGKVTGAPAMDITISGHACRSNHHCDFYGYNYNWCYTDDNNNWDYCKSHTITDDNHSELFRKKRQMNNNGCQNIRLDQQIETRLASSSNQIRNSAYELIEQITANSHIFQSGTIHNNNVVRLDAQGRFQQNGTTYYNLQIQLNTLRHGSTRSTSIAQVFVPENLNIATHYEDIKQALRDSLNSTKKENPYKVIIEIQNMNNRFG